MSNQAILSDRKKKFRKFLREHNENDIPLEVQKRDIEILELVYKYRFLNADHIRALMGNSQKAVSHRLTRLYRAGYLDRPIKQVRLYYRHDYKKSEPIIYALGRRGAEVLAEIKEGQIDGLDWRRKNFEVKDRTLLHDIGVANFGVILRLAIEKQVNDTSLLFWKQDRQDREEIKDKVLVFNKKKKKKRKYRLSFRTLFSGSNIQKEGLFFS